MLSRDIWIRHAIRVTPDSLGYPHYHPSLAVPALLLTNVRPILHHPQCSCSPSVHHGGREEEKLELFHYRRRFIIKMIRIMFYHGSRMQRGARCIHPCVDNCISYRWLTLCDLSKQPDILPLLSKHYILLISPISYPDCWLSLTILPQ